MGYHADTYTEYSNRMSDWMKHSATGANISNRVLDLANRAQYWLTMHKPWSDMIKQTALTMSGNTASLPSDFARIIRVGYDTDGDGKLDGHYFFHGRSNYGYYLTDTFTKAAGHSKTITFYNTLSQAPYLEYQFKLDDFANSGTEYSFFPGELLLKTAQRLHIGETGLTSAEVSIIIAEQKQQLKDYAAAHHYVNIELRRRINDDLGNEIRPGAIDLSGGDVEPYQTGLSRSTDDRLFL